MRASFSRLVTLLGAAAVIAAFGGACSSTNDSPPESNGTLGGVDSGFVDAGCADPTNPGCACSTEGATTPCNHVVQRNGNYITCTSGTTTCTNGHWGECVGNKMTAKSIPGRHMTGAGWKTTAGATSCANVCDPNGCTSVNQNGNDITDASGLTYDDGGVSIQPVPYTGDAGGGNLNCVGLECNLTYCKNGGTTSLTGTVYDPASKNPLYNAYVYIPVDPDTSKLPSFTDGPSCDSCSGSQIKSIASAQTGPDGKFTMTNVPAGNNIPLVMQMGKWRRIVTIPTITACQATAVDPALTRMPRNQSEGHIPKIAFVSGNADPFECLFPKMGIDPNEVGSLTKNANRRIHYFSGTGKPGATIDPTYGDNVTADSLYGANGGTNNLALYDAVILACEGGEYDKGTTAYTNLVNYANAGGRVFATHYSYVWLDPPSWTGIANNFNGNASWRWAVSSGASGGTRGDVTVDPLTSTIITAGFPKGAAFSQWINIVGANGSGGVGTIDIHQGRRDLSTAGASSQAWLTANDNGNNFNPHFTFNTPYGAAANTQCGRVLFSDFHVSAAATMSGGSSCSVDTDCGVSATCLPATPGTCAAQSCTSSANCPSTYSCTGATLGTCTTETCELVSDCYDGTYSCSGTHGLCSTGTCLQNSDCTNASDATCQGPVAGKCGTATCYQNSDCLNGNACSGSTIGKCTCEKSSECPSGGTCGGMTAGTCGTATCFHNSDCGAAGSGTCTGATLGKCGCATNADCTTLGAGATCSAGLCVNATCGTNADCAAAGTHVCNGTKTKGKCGCYQTADCTTLSAGTCTGGTMGTCSVATCSASAQCAAGRTCGGAIKGKCGCLTNPDCPSGAGTCSGQTKGKCTCGIYSGCPSGGGSCTGGTSGACTKGCATTADCWQNGSSNAEQCVGGSCKGCASSNDCPGSTTTCTGGAQGTCTKSCAQNSDCAGTELCVGGKCQGCYSSSDCPGGLSCSGYVAPQCSATGTSFPLVCKQGDLSAQEKALEFMLFDLTACISPDNVPPPGPPPPQFVFPTVTFSQDFVGQCPAAQVPVWREFDWQVKQASNASGATSLDLKVQTGPSTANLTPATPLKLTHATASTALPAYDGALIDTGPGPIGTGVFNTANPWIRSSTVLRVTITLNPTPDQQAAPTLYAWKVQYDCVDAE